MDPTALLLELIPQNLFTPSTLTILWRLNTPLHNYITQLFQSLAAPLYHHLPNIPTLMPIYSKKWIEKYLPLNLYHLIYIIQQTNPKHFYHITMGHWGHCHDCSTYGRLQWCAYSRRYDMDDCYTKLVCWDTCTFLCECGTIVKSQHNGGIWYNNDIECPSCHKNQSPTRLDAYGNHK